MKDKLVTTNIEYDGHIIKFIVKETKNKNAYLKVSSSGEIVLSKPKRMRDKKVKEFVDMNIERMLKAAIKMKAAVPYSLEEGWIIIWGHKKPLIFKEGRGYEIEEESITIKGASPEVALRNFVKNYSKILIDIALVMAKEENIEIEIKVKNMKSKWGVCYPKEKLISFSSRLIHFNEKIVNYVIIHELCHMYEANHSANFWAEVEKRCHDYKNIRKKLERW